jgi:hypothetical protein
MYEGKGRKEGRRPKSEVKQTTKKNKNMLIDGEI